MTDKIKINSTFERIEKSLNLRFEKKGALFISKDGLEELKSELYNSNMQNILALELKIKAPIIMQVILKNPWLINDSFLKNKDFKTYLRKNLSAEDATQYINILKNVVEDKIFSTAEFKSYIESFYYNLINVEECKEIVQWNDSKPKVLTMCFKRMINASTESSEFKIREVNDFLESSEEIYNSVKSSDYLNDVVSNMDDKPYIAQWIIDNKTSSKIDPIWSNAFIRLELAAFEVSINEVENNLEFNELSKWIIRNVFQKLLNRNDENLERYIAGIIQLYKNRDAYRIKILFLDMLQPGKFRNQEVALKLITEFEKMGISDKFTERVKKIKNWEEDSRGYLSSTVAYEDVSKDGSDVEKQKTLDYISREFKKTDYSVLVQLYVKYNTNYKVKKALSYYMVNDMRRQSSKLMSEIGDLSEEYITCMAELIVEYSINSETILEFLHKNGKQDIIKKLTRR